MEAIHPALRRAIIAARSAPAPQPQKRRRVVQPMTVVVVRDPAAPPPHIEDIVFELTEYEDGQAGVITIERIKEVVRQFFGLRKGELEAKLGERRLARPRYLAMFLSRKITGRATTIIVKHFGSRDHGAVYDALRKIPQMIAEDPQFAIQVAAIIKRLQPETAS